MKNSIIGYEGERDLGGERSARVKVKKKEEEKQIVREVRES